MKVLAAALVTLCIASPVAAEIVKPSLRKTAPDFALPARDRAIVKLSSLKGKVVLLDFWATWCAGCKVEIPWFVEFHKTYKARGLSAVGIAFDDDGWKVLTPYLAKNPIGYTIVAGTPEDAERYGVTALPVTLLIDRSGRIAATHRGVVERKAFERELQQLLAER